MNSVESAIWGIVLGGILTAIGLILNIAQIPDAWRFFGIASDVAVRSDVRALSIAFVVETVCRTIGKAVILLVMSLLAARIVGLLDNSIGVLLIYLLDVSLFFFDIASAATIWARRAVRVANEEQAG